MDLEHLRDGLDELDTQLIGLLARRARLVAEIWRWKEEHGVPRVDARREEEMKVRLLRQATSLGLKPDAIEAVLDRVIGRALQ